MTAVSAVTSSSQSVSAASQTVSIGLQPGLTRTTTGSQSTGKVVSSKEGSQAVTKALDNSTQVFVKLQALQAEIKAASAPGAKLSTDQAKALNDKIKAVADDIDKLAAGAKVGNTNLLEKSTGGVTIATQSGTKVNIATRALDSKALGLRDINVTDAASLSKATATVAQATGQAQLSVFSLQTADGITGKAAPVNPGLAAFDKINSSQNTAPAKGSALDSLAKALANQSAAQATNYGSSGSLSSSSSPSILSLFA